MKQHRNYFEISRFKHVKALYWLAVFSAIGAVVVLPLWFFDHRELGGVSVWVKPLKFLISSAIFSITFSWLSSFITKGVRLVKAAGWVISVSLTVELVIIVAMASIGRTSHFNVSSPTSIVLWSLMATFISFVLFSTLLLSIMIFIQKGNPRDLKLTLALGSLNTAIGMGLAYLMTFPTSKQLANFKGIAGAHSVGVDDGGPGLPFFGWSTVGGDLRVGHFFGLHSIQVAAILLAVSLLLPVAYRLPLLIVGNITWLGLMGLLTWQALRAESVASPSGLTITSFVITIAIAAIAFFAGSRLRKFQSLLA
jgi:hypothetical protein